MPFSTSTNLQTARDRAALLMATSVLAIGASLGVRDFGPVDEPRFALVATQMVATGSSLFPRRGAELHPDKRLFMWISAALLSLTQNLRTAVLAPSLVSGVAYVWMAFHLGTRNGGRVR